MKKSYIGIYNFCLFYYSKLNHKKAHRRTLFEGLWMKFVEISWCIVYIQIADWTRFDDPISVRLLSSDFGCQNKLDFRLKLNILQRNYFILWIDITLSQQKLGIILENKLFENWSYKKKIYIYLGPKLIFLNKKKSKTLFTKYNYFFGVCSILVKKVTNLDPPKSELNNLTNTKLILSM